MHILQEKLIKEEKNWELVHLCVLQIKLETVSLASRSAGVQQNS